MPKACLLIEARKKVKSQKKVIFNIQIELGFYYLLHELLLLVGELLLFGSLEPACAGLLFLSSLALCTACPTFWPQSIKACE